MSKNVRVDPSPFFFSQKPQPVAWPRRPRAKILLQRPERVDPSLAAVWVGTRFQDIIRCLLYDRFELGRTEGAILSDDERRKAGNVRSSHGCPGGEIVLPAGRRSSCRAPGIIQK